MRYVISSIYCSTFNFSFLFYTTDLKFIYFYFYLSLLLLSLLDSLYPLLPKVNRSPSSVIVIAFGDYLTPSPIRSLIFFWREHICTGIQLSWLIVLEYRRNLPGPEHSLTLQRTKQALRHDLPVTYQISGRADTKFQVSWFPEILL